MARSEPMDIDSEFDNKENSLHHSNVLPRTPCTEKGYEELDVSELNMKLRYSITPVSSPMSKSFTANSLDNKTFDSEDYINNVVSNENSNLTRSLNSTITRNETAKLPKSLPLQELSSESITSVLRALDNTPKVLENNETLTLSGQNYLDDNMSLPSTSSTTPEATTPIKEIPKHDGGSPIMRGLKSVLNMFRSSQSPIPPADVNVTLNQEILSPKESVIIEEQSRPPLGKASTPILNKQRENNSSQRSSPLKESIVFNDDLERELQWKDETTILFKEEKIPIHKLLLPQTLSSMLKTGENAPPWSSVSNNAERENLNNTVEQMDISYGDSFLDSKAGRPIQSVTTTNVNDSFLTESDSEFVDCETSINNVDITNNKILENFTSSINSKNISHRQTHILQEHSRSTIANNSSEIPLNISFDDNHLETDYEKKSQISTNNKNDCKNQEILADSEAKIHDPISNLAGDSLSGYQNEIFSKIVEENSGDKFGQLNETGLVNKSNMQNNITTSISLGECLSEEQNIKTEEIFIYSKHPSDIPLPDEDDVENVLNFDPVTITAVNQQDINLKTDQQMDMSIDNNETSIIEQDYSHSPNKETKESSLDCMDKNKISVQEINQEIVVISINNEELINAQSIDKEKNVQILGSNDNLKLQVESVPLQETNRVSLVDEELNLEINGKILMDSLEPNTVKYIEAVSIENETICNDIINQSENDIILAHASNQCAIVQHINEINNESNLQIIDSQEHETTSVLEENNLEKVENINCTKYLGNDSSFSSDDKNGEVCSSIEKLHVYLSEVCSEIKLENNSLGVPANPHTITDPENITIDVSKAQAFIHNDDENTETDTGIPQTGQEAQDSETISQSKHLLEPDNAFCVLKENTISADLEITCNAIENIESVTLEKEMLVTGTAVKIEKSCSEKAKDTLLKEVIQSLQEENCTGIPIDSNTAFKYNINELSMHISPTNETFNMSLAPGDILENKQMKDKTDKFDHDTNTLCSYVHNKENEVIKNNDLDNTVSNKTVCDVQLVNHCTPNATFNMSIDQEGVIENKEMEAKRNEHKTDGIDIHVLRNETFNNCNVHNIVIPNIPEECGLNQDGAAVCNSTLNGDNHMCQKDEIEGNKNKQMIHESEQEIDTINVSQQNIVLDSHTVNNVVVNEIDKLTPKTDSNVASNSTFNMSIDQEDISEKKEIEGKIEECDFKTNVVNIVLQENEIIGNNNCNNDVANEIEECALSSQNIIVSNSNIDNQVISNEHSNATFCMSGGKECIRENEEIKEESFINEYEANEIGEKATNKQTVIVSNTKLNDCATSSATYVAENDKEKNKMLGQLTDETHKKPKDNTDPVFVPELLPSENVFITADVQDRKNFNNELFITGCEITNDLAKQVTYSMNTSLKTLILSKQNENDKRELVNFDVKTENNTEPGDCFTMERKDQKSPPLSPVISSQGYNFNFDEIDDPYATKTKMGSSPPPEHCIGSNEKEIKKIKPANKKDVQKRKSMPIKRQLPQSKNKINASFSEAIDYKEIKQCTKTTEKVQTKNEINKSTCDNTQISENFSTIQEKSSIQNTELPYCQTDFDELKNNENVYKPDVLCTDNKTSSNEVEIVSSLNKSNASSVDNRVTKNVFNLPEMSTDMNFSPFASKSKVCRTPSPVLETCTSTFKVPANFKECDLQNVNSDNNVERDVAKLHVGAKADNDLSIASSSSKETQDATVREVNTEDEDTVEGPFFEADELKDDDKMSDIVADSEDMMNFDDTIPQETDGNIDDGEMFIDAEAFEFLLNQNKSNMVVDSGKESLFLKFDPLFANRMSSGGVLAALNKVQKRQSTPKRISKAPTIDVTSDKMSPGSANLNAATEVNSILENNFEDPNTTVSKPMMVVNPAVNSVISPRNKPVATPPRANRRSLTFTSPAIAVIDRLLSLSGNNSILNSGTPPRQVQREQSETDLALTQLRETLAEKEIYVHNLRMESKELKERLSTLETHVKSLETESEQRLRKVNELNERLIEKTKINRSMAAVVEEYERTIASLIAETEQDRKRHAEERARLVSERDEQTAHLASMEISFNDLHSKYEKCKQIILACKSNEDAYKRSIKEFEENLLKMQNNYELLKQHATSKLNQANQELEKLNRAHQAEVVKLNAMIKRKELHITSLEETVTQKTKANEELTAICDELINKVG